jgi:hypothetical protein
MARFGDESSDAAGAYEQEMQLSPIPYSPLDCPHLQHQLIQQSPPLFPLPLLPYLLLGANNPPAVPAFTLEPQLPPLDPTIVEALQKVLKQAGDLGVPRLILHVGEQPGNEEQENPETSDWRSQPNDVEFPSLFVDPVDDPLTIVEQEESADKVEASPIDLAGLIQEVIDVIHSGQSILVENAGVGLELELEVDLKGANVKVLSGYSGHRFVLVSLSPEAAGDLRAAQLAHNERILHWIESLNEELFDCDAAEEEDADYGVEPVNEAIP